MHKAGGDSEFTELPDASKINCELMNNLTLLMREEVENRSEEHTSELQSRETISYAVFCLKKKKIYRFVFHLS